MIDLPLYTSAAILHTFFINLTLTLSAAVDNVPPQPPLKKKSKLQYTGKNIT